MLSTIQQAHVAQDSLFTAEDTQSGGWVFSELCFNLPAHTEDMNSNPNDSSATRDSIISPVAPAGHGIHTNFLLQLWHTPPYLFLRRWAAEWEAAGWQFLNLGEGSPCGRRKGQKLLTRVVCGTGSMITRGGAIPSCNLGDFSKDTNSSRAMGNALSLEGPEATDRKGWEGKNWIEGWWQTFPPGGFAPAPPCSKGPSRNKYLNHLPQTPKRSVHFLYTCFKLI